MRRCHLPCLILLLQLAGTCHAQEVAQNMLLVEFEDQIFKTAVTSARTEAAPVAAAAAAAAAAGARAGAAVPTLSSPVAMAAAAIPAAERLASNIVGSARKRRIRIRRYQPYGIVFDGMSVETDTPADADALRALLKTDAKVKKIYPVYMVPLPTHVKPTVTRESLVMKPAAAAIEVQSTVQRGLLDADAGINAAAAGAGATILTSNSSIALSSSSSSGLPPDNGTTAINSSGANPPRSQPYNPPTAINDSSNTSGAPLSSQTSVPSPSPDNQSTSTSVPSFSPSPSSPVPEYLQPAQSADDIDYTVRLPLGPKGSTINFTPNVEWASADLLTGVSELRSNFRLTGKGIKIGIIDTGIDYTHPAFGGCTGINKPFGRCRVVAGKDLVGKEYTAATDIPKPDDDPRDCYNGSHGTTVAGVAAGGWHPSAKMLGVAPQASLGIYKVFGCSGSAPTSAIIAAIQQAVLDGMDIINLSLSLGPGFPAEPYASVMKRVFALGVLSVKSAGNQGLPVGQGLFWVDAFTGAGSIMVAAADTSSGIVGRLTASEFSTWGPDGNLNLLPTVSAPGSNILTTTSKGFEDGYTLVSGTSHATPYLAGGLALVLQTQQTYGDFSSSSSSNSSDQQASGQQWIEQHDLVSTSAIQPHTYQSSLPAQASNSSHRVSTAGSLPDVHAGQTPAAPSLTINQASRQTLSQSPVKRTYQASLIPALVSTATNVAWGFDETVSSAVGKSGAGLVNLAALYYNPVQVTPSYISLPSGVLTSHTVQVTLLNTSPSWGLDSKGQTFKYNVLHRQSAVAAEIYDTWGATEMTLKPQVGPMVTVSPREVVLPPGSTVTLQVTFNLPPKFRRRPWLYSGYIDLLPVTSTASMDVGTNSSAPSVNQVQQQVQANATQHIATNPDKAATGSTVWSPLDRWRPWWHYCRRYNTIPPPKPLVIPYQGVSKNYSSLPLVPDENSFLGLLAPGLCYAPGEENKNYPEYAMDIAYDVNQCEINTADPWGGVEPIQISLRQLQERPCDLRITMSPQLPVKRMVLELLDTKGKLLGTLPSLETPVYSRAPAYDASSDGTPGTESPPLYAVYSYCLSWQGRYIPASEPAGSTRQVSVAVGRTYKLNALLETPTAVGDLDRVQSPVFVKVPIQGKFKVVRNAAGGRRRGLL